MAKQVPPIPRTSSKLQLNHKTINLNNHLKTSRTEVLLLSTYRKSHKEIQRRGRDVKRAIPVPTDSSGGFEGISQLQRCPIRSDSSQPQPRAHVKGKAHIILVVKIRRDSIFPDEIRDCQKPRASAQNLTCRHSSQALAEETQLRGGQSHTGKD